MSVCSFHMPSDDRHEARRDVGQPEYPVWDGGRLTRGGADMPDALSKTVPIWIAVVNRLLFPECGWSHELHFPEQIVPASERAQIEARLDGFVKDAEVSIFLPETPSSEYIVARLWKLVLVLTCSRASDSTSQSSEATSQGQ